MNQSTLEPKTRSRPKFKTEPRAAPLPSTGHLEEEAKQKESDGNLLRGHPIPFLIVGLWSAIVLGMLGIWILGCVC